MSAPTVDLCPLCGPVVGRQWVLHANAPADWLSSNKRTDRRSETPDRRAWRDLGAVLARQAKVPHLDRAHVLFTVHYADRRRRDAHNLLATAKAFVDGLVDAGVLVDDSDDYLIGPDMRRGKPVVKRPYGPAGAITVTITDLSGSA